MLDESALSRRSRREAKRRVTVCVNGPSLEIGSIAQMGVEDSAEPVDHGDDRAFVAAPRTELQKIRMQRMRGASGVLRALAERAELGRPTLGDMAVTIAVRGLVGARNQARVTRDVPTSMLATTRSEAVSMTVTVAAPSLLTQTLRPS